MSEKTLDSYVDTVRLHIKPSLGRKLLRKLTVSDVDRLSRVQAQGRLQHHTVRIIRLVSLRRALRQAERGRPGFTQRAACPPHRAFAATTKVEPFL